MSPNSDQLVWWILGLYGFLQLVHLILALYRLTRPDPPLREILKEYVTRERFDAFERQTNSTIETSMESIDDRLSGLHKSFKEEQKTAQTLFQDLMKAVSNIEGQLKIRTK